MSRQVRGPERAWGWEQGQGPGLSRGVGATHSIYVISLSCDVEIIPILQWKKLGIGEVT